jgi:ankyrin repeat protein
MQWEMTAPEAVAAIHMAAEEGDVETVARMLNEDPRLLSSELHLHTQLTRAASRGHVGVVRLLLGRRTAIDQPDGTGRTALQIAATYGQEELVQFLLTNGADPSKRSFRGTSTALMYASLCGHAGVVRLLLRSVGGRGLDVRSDDGCTAVWRACCRGHVDILRALLSAGADHTITGKNGTTPREVAYWENRRRCVALIEVRPSVADASTNTLTATTVHGWPVYLVGVKQMLLSYLCCSGGRASCSVPMSSTRPGLYTKTPPHTSKPLQPQCQPT